MNPHPSDLALERALRSEDGTQGTRAHVHGCPDCWRRWAHLHADEQLSMPQRVTRATPANTALSASWALTGVASLVALAALSMLWVQPGAERGEITRLGEQVSQLQLQLREAEASQASAQLQGRPPSVRRDAGAASTTRPQRPSTTTLGLSSIPSEILDDAVQNEIERRTLDKLDDSRTKYQGGQLERIGSVVDTVVAKGILADHNAADVELLLQRELEETWDIKSAAVTGDLSKEEAFEDWRLLVEETDRALARHLNGQELADLRVALEEK
jgi:hypothetical protein